MTVETRKLSKSFAGRTVLEDACVVIPERTLVGLYGPSGIGKSTLARILCGIVKPDAGEVLLDGKKLFSADTPYDRRRGLAIQMVWQQPYATLDPRQRIGAGFTELLRYHRLCRRNEEEDRVQSMLQSVGLGENILGQLPSQISGGEAQRTAIARCLLFDPGLLILDEATSMLDVSTQANVLGMVRRKMAGHGGSVLLISHDRALIGHLSEKLYVFKGNHIEEEEP